MLSRFKQYFLIAFIVAAFYFLLNHHIIIFNYNDIELLKKAEPTLEYTFFSLRKPNPLKILQNDTLLDAGIEDIMIERGILTEQRLNHLLDIVEKMRAREEQRAQQQ